ncbi:MAG TPA: acetyl-CoA C-acyltransferase [Gammaproteobacteria bacterium]|nr:acetyl-CoA C-acyltransferase [Gammaproteobacteria bacterium]
MDKLDKDALVIVGMARTPIGGLLGELKEFSAWQLGGEAIKSAVSRSGLKPEDIQEVLMGCVLPAGMGQAPARQAALSAGLPNSVSCTTINKVCGSGMKSIMLANPELITVAGGMESMTNSPYLLLKARVGYRAGHAEQIKDHMFLDGLEDAYDRGKLMGVFAENTAKKYNITRQEQDAFALESLLRAQKSNFKDEISPIGLIERDELPQRAKPEKIPQLKPAFYPNGTVTAANSSSISDGAAALVIMSESEAKKRNLKPLAKIIGSSTHSHDPAWFTTAPVEAIKKLLQKINWDIKDVDLFEINEAFAVVTLVAMKELNLSHSKVNIHGGACALGHPIGASGARIVVTLISALKQHGLKRGVASLCIGGGEATALAVELI